MVTLALTIAAGIVLGQAALFVILVTWATIANWRTDRINAYHQEREAMRLANLRT